MPVSAMRRSKRNVKRTPLHLAYLLLVMALVSGCRPKGILSQREMVNVICDMHYADAVLQISGMTYGHSEDAAKAYQIMLNKHGVTQAQLDSSLAWYTNHPHRFEKIYPKVLARLENQRDTWKTAKANALKMMEQEQPPLRDVEEVMDVMRDGLQMDWRISAKKIMNIGDTLQFAGVLEQFQDIICIKMQENAADTCIFEK